MIDVDELANEREAFVTSYVDTALDVFTTFDDEWPKDDGPATRDHLEAASLALLEKQAGEFFDAHHADLAAFTPHVTSGRKSYTWGGIGGYLYWMNRNGEGVGFWDGDYPKEIGERLDAAAKHQDVDLYLGDDGVIYVIGAE